MGRKWCDRIAASISATDHRQCDGASAEVFFTGRCWHSTDLHRLVPSLQLDNWPYFSRVGTEQHWLQSEDTYSNCQTSGMNGGIKRYACSLQGPDALISHHVSSILWLDGSMIVRSRLALASFTIAVFQDVSRLAF
jgi:hypothetical protein